MLKIILDIWTSSLCSPFTDRRKPLSIIMQNVEQFIASDVDGASDETDGKIH